MNYITRCFYCGCNLIPGATDCANHCNAKHAEQREQNADARMTAMLDQVKAIQAIAEEQGRQIERIQTSIERLLTKLTS